MDAIDILNNKTKLSQSISKVKLREKQAAERQLYAELQDLAALDKFDEEIAIAAAKIFWVDAATDKGVTQKCVSALEAARRKYSAFENKLKDAESQKQSIGTLEEVRASNDGMQSELSTVSMELQQCQEKIVAAGRDVGARDVAVSRITENIKNLTSRMNAGKREVPTRFCYEWFFS